ncbi:MAG: hypothetical protein LBS07_04600, partial [Prevotellaceae bacterium]|nr:hypothetical protein [Prevotellaceae bacterium]
MKNKQNITDNKVPSLRVGCKTGVLVLTLSLFICQPIFSQLRERINIDEDWKFHLGHAANPEKDFQYGLARLFAKTAENYGTCIVTGFDDS